MIISSFYPHLGGAEQQAQRVSARLIADGWRVEIVTRQHGPHFTQPPPKYEVIAGAPVHRIPSPGPGKIGSLLFFLGSLWFVLRESRRGGPYIFHAHALGAPAFVALVAGLVRGGPTIIKIRGGAAAFEDLHRSFLARLQFRLIRQAADSFLVVSKEMSELLQKEGVDPHRIAHIVNGVDIIAFQPATPTEKQTRRQQLNLPTNRRIVLYVGRLENIKGVDILLQAWSQLPQPAQRDALLVIVGDGSQRPALEAFAAGHIAPETIHFAGRQHDVLPYLQAADLFVLPSRSEGFSNALAEAMACGLPAVASAVGGNPELVEDGANGFLFPADDHHTLCHILSRALSHQQSLAAMSTRARQTAVDKASLESNIRQLQILYRNLLSHPSRT